MKRIVTIFLLFISALSAHAQIVSRDGSNVLRDSAAVEVEIDSVTSISIEATFTPIPECDSFCVLIGVPSEMEEWVSVMGLPMSQLIKEWGLSSNSVLNHTFSDLLPSTDYEIYVLPYVLGEEQTYETTLCSTLSLGGTGIAEIEISISDITATSVVFTAVPNSEVSVFYDGLIQTDLFDEVGQDSAIKIILEPQYALYETDVWTWEDLTPDTQYKAIAIGKNANEEWGPAEIVDFSTLATTNINDKIVKKFTVYPTINNGSFLVSTDPENIGNIVSVYDASGKLVFETVMNSENQNVTLSKNRGIYILVMSNNSGVVHSVEKIVIE